MSIIYGIDTTKKISASDVRDAIIACFYNAHCADSALPQNDSKTVKEYCTGIIELAFSETGGDFANPNKDSLVKAIEYLKKFSLNFRNPEVVNQHFQEIKELVDLVDQK